MFPAAEKAQRLAADLHDAIGQRRPSSAPGIRSGSGSEKLPQTAAAAIPTHVAATNTDRRVHMTKIDYMRHMLQLEREARKKDEKTIERQGKTIAMLTDHLERLMGGMRAYAEMKLAADTKVHALRHACQRLRTVIDKQQLSISVHQQLIGSLRDTGGVLERQLSDMDRRYSDIRGALVQLKKQHKVALDAKAGATQTAASAAAAAPELERPTYAPGFKSSAAWPGASTSATTLGIVSPPPTVSPERARQETRVKRRKDNQAAAATAVPAAQQPMATHDAATPLVSLPPGLQDDDEEARGDFYTAGRYSFSRPGTGVGARAGAGTGATDDAEEAKWLRFLVGTPPDTETATPPGGGGGSDGAERRVEGDGVAAGAAHKEPFSALKWYDAERARRKGGSLQTALAAALMYLPPHGSGSPGSATDATSGPRRRLSKVFDQSALSPAADERGMVGFSEPGLKKLVAKLVRLALCVCVSFPSFRPLTHSCFACMRW